MPNVEICADIFYEFSSLCVDPLFVASIDSLINFLQLLVTNCRPTNMPCFISSGTTLSDVVDPWNPLHRLGYGTHHASTVVTNTEPVNGATMLMIASNMIGMITVVSVIHPLFMLDTEGFFAFNMTAQIAIFSQTVGFAPVGFAPVGFAPAPTEFALGAQLGAWFRVESTYSRSIPGAQNKRVSYF
jgi:hypothetical protein